MPQRTQWCIWLDNKWNIIFYYSNFESAFAICFTFWVVSPSPLGSHSAANVSRMPFHHFSSTDSSLWWNTTSKIFFTQRIHVCKQNFWLFHVGKCLYFVLKLGQLSSIFKIIFLHNAEDISLLTSSFCSCIWFFVWFFHLNDFRIFLIIIRNFFSVQLDVNSFKNSSYSGHGEPIQLKGLYLSSDPKNILLFQNCFFPCVCSF